MPVPVAAAGVSALGGIFGNRQNSAESAALGAQTNLANQQAQLSKTASDLSNKSYSLAEPAISTAMKYYTTLTNGSPANLNAALQPQYAQIADTYRGAQRGIDSSLTGPQRQMALGDLYRQKAASTAGLPMQARSGAAAALGSLGSQTAGQAGSYLSSASGAATAGANNYQQVLGNYQNQRTSWQNLGNSLGQMFIPYIMKNYGNANLFGGGGGNQNLPGWSDGYGTE